MKMPDCSLVLKMGCCNQARHKSPGTMSEFKYACPVCGQHIQCDSTQSGTVMECPTCFQKITAPQAPKTDDPKFIITGTKVGERPIPRVLGGDLNPVRARKNSWWVASLILMLAVVAAAAGACFRAD